MIGQTISHYKILQKLGEGGMGVVYKAEDTKLKRIVALKFLPQQLTANETDKARFLQEAQAAAAINHPNVCTIFDIQEHDGQQFIVMEFVEGQTLRDKIKDERLKIKDIIDYAIQIADALKVAHAKDIIHRDIKSENIMVTSSGQIKVMDFGLAKLRGSVKLTKTSTTAGTLSYSSPEQIQGKEADARSDIFSFGVVLYEMLTGRLPFKGEYESALIYSILDEEPEPVQKFIPGVSSELIHIINRILEKDPENRYQSMKDVLIDLKRVKREVEKIQPASIQPSPESDKQKNSRRKFRWLIFTSAILAVSVFIVTISRHAGQTIDPESKIMLAILPFENLGPPEDEYFADGITEEITSRLSCLHELGVISRTSANQYKNSNKPLSQIGKELGVNYVLEGTIRWEQRSEGVGRVRITPQLIRITDDTHLWTEQYDRTLENVFNLQSDIAEQVAEQLDLKILEPERQALRARPTENLDAYDYYLQGLEYLNRGFELDDKVAFEHAAEDVEKAVELDSSFAIAYLLLSNIYSWQYFVGYDRTEERINQSKLAIDKVFLLQPNLPNAYASLAYYYYRGFLDYERALETLAIARKLRPSLSPELIGYVKRRQGKWEESIEALKESIRINPRSAMDAHELGNCYRHIRNYFEANLWYDRAISINPNFHISKIYKAWISLSRTGQSQQAITILNQLPRDPFPLINLIRIHQIARNYTKALELLDSLSFDSYEYQTYYFHKDLAYTTIYHCMHNVRLISVYAGSALKDIESRVSDYPSDPRFRAAYGLVLAYLSRKEEAIREGKQAVKLYPVSKDAMDGPAYIENLARIYTIVGESEVAIDELSYLLSIPCELSVPLLQVDPMWDNLRNHHAFQILIKNERGPGS